MKWVITEDYSANALRLYSESVLSGDGVVAPELLRFEVSNIFRQKMVRDALGLDEAVQGLRQLLTYPVTLVTYPGIHEEALRLAAQVSLPATYDAHYVVLAQRLGCSLWTADRRLIRTLAGRLPFVRWIGDYTPGMPL